MRTNIRVRTVRTVIVTLADVERAVRTNGSQVAIGLAIGERTLRSNNDHRRRPQIARPQLELGNGAVVVVAVEPVGRHAIAERQTVRVMDARAK